MATRCFVFKTIESVQNDALLGITEARIHIYANQPLLNNVILSFYKKQQIHIIGDGYFTDEKGLTNLGKEMAIGEEGTKIFVKTDSECEISIPDIYALKYLGSINEANTLAQMDVRFLYGSNILIVNVQSSLLLGHLSTESLSKMPKISSIRGYVEGDLNKLSSSNVQSFDIQGPIFGNIETLTNWTNLSWIHFGTNMNITGDIKKLCEGLYKNGKRSGFARLSLQDTACTFGEEPAKLVTATFTSEGVQYS